VVRLLFGIASFATASCCSHWWLPRVAFESSPSTSFWTFSRCSTLRRTAARAGEGRLGIL